MRAVCDGYASGARIGRHLQIVGRVANHHRALDLHAEIAREFEQHRGVRLGERLIGAACVVEDSRQIRRLHCTLQANSGFARRHRQQIVLAAQRFQHFAHARKQHEMRVAAEVMEAISIGQLAVVGRIERGDRIFKRIPQAQSYHVTRPRVVGHRQIKIPAG